jgi:hypothetical protein
MKHSRTETLSGMGSFHFPLPHIANYSAKAALSVTHGTLGCDLQHPDKPVSTIEKVDVVNKHDLVTAWATGYGSPRHGFSETWIISGNRVDVQLCFGVECFLLPSR